MWSTHAALMAFVPVTDMARAFYEGTLGLTVRTGDDYGCLLNAQGSLLRLALVGEFERPPHTVLGWSVGDIAASVQALAARGVVFHRYDGMVQDELGIWVAPSQDRVAWFPDSEGNTLSLTQPV
jgi:catechol 2,3-dioxygenase-like lactoylglutathione lyase family enzyme